MGKAFPEEARELYDKGMIYESAGRFVDATECLREALVKAPESHFIRLRLARVLGAQRDDDDDFREEAIELCRQVADQCDEDNEVVSQAWFLMASLLDDSPERYEEAAKAYKAGLEIDGEFIVGHNNLGAVLCELARFDEAEGHFFQAIALRPEYTKVYQNLAKMYFRWVGQERLQSGVERLIEGHPQEAPEILNRLMVALVDFARQDAYEDFYSRGHRLKNLFAILGTRTKRFKRKSVAGQLEGETLATQMEGLLKSMQEATEELKEFLALLRPRPSEHHLVDLNELIRHVEAIINETGVRLTTVLAERLPQVVGSPTALREAIVNLAKNALDAATEKGEIRITSRFDEFHQEVVITVDDSGPGVPPNKKRDVFRPGVTTKSGGNGLGLAVVKRVAQDLGGRAEVADSFLGGACFMLYIPAVEGEGAVIGRGLGDRRIQQETTSSLLAEELTENENE